MTDIATAARTLIDAYGGIVPDWLATEVADLESAIDEQIQIPRTPTDAMMDAGLYHCSADMTHSDLHTAFQAMFDAVMLDGGCSTHAPAQVTKPAKAEIAHDVFTVRAKYFTPVGAARELVFNLKADSLQEATAKAHGDLDRRTKGRARFATFDITTTTKDTTND